MVDMAGATMSSVRTDYETPHALYAGLDRKFHFTLDAAASHDNAKCKTYYTVDDDGLAKPWPGNVWVNPPYGKYLTGKWVYKAYRESFENSDIICMLLPSRTDTIWFHEYVMAAATSVWFIKGRLKFVGEKHAAAFPSMIVLFERKKPLHRPLIVSCDRVGNIL